MKIQNIISSCDKRKFLSIVANVYSNFYFTRSSIPPVNDDNGILIVDSKLASNFAINSNLDGQGSFRNRNIFPILLGEES